MSKPSGMKLGLPNPNTNKNKSEVDSYAFDNEFLENEEEDVINN